MKNLAIINLGNHDIRIKEGKQKEIAKLFSELENIETIESDRNWIQFNYYKFTKKLYDEYPKGIDCVEFPIVQATMESISEEINTSSLGKIIFVTTDQKKYKEKDTIYLGKLFLKIGNDKTSNLKKTLKFNKVAKVNGIPNLELYQITRSPQDFDIMLKEYSEIISKSNKVDNIFMNITSGTQAMNLALLYNVANKIDANYYPLYTDKITGRAELIKVADSIKTDNIKKEIINFVSERLYEAAKITINRCDYFKKEKEEELLNLIEAAKSKIEFDFKESKLLLKEIKKNDPDSREICNEFENSLIKLIDKDRVYLLNEVKNNAIYKYKSGAYTDFLGRIFRIQEEIYKIILEKNGYVTVDKEDKCRVKIGKLTPEQINKLDNYKTDEGDHLIYKDTTLNIFSMACIIKLIIHDDSEEYRIFKECDEKLTGLKGKRNNSILAHGYEGISKEFIDTNINNVENFLDDLIDRVSSIYGDGYINDNFYATENKNDFNKYIIKLIEEL